MYPPPDSMRGSGGGRDGSFSAETRQGGKSLRDESLLPVGPFFFFLFAFSAGSSVLEGVGSDLFAVSGEEEFPH